MKNTRATAEQIRTILRAMEASIDSARRRRLNETSHDSGPATGESADDADRTRRKARPKRDGITGDRAPARPNGQQSRPGSLSQRVPVEERT